VNRLRQRRHPGGTCIGGVHTDRLRRARDRICPAFRSVWLHAVRPTTWVRAGVAGLVDAPARVGRPTFPALRSAGSKRVPPASGVSTTSRRLSAPRAMIRARLQRRWLRYYPVFREPHRGDATLHVAHREVVFSLTGHLWTGRGWI